MKGISRERQKESDKGTDRQESQAETQRPEREGTHTHNLRQGEDRKREWLIELLTAKWRERGATSM